MIAAHYIVLSRIGLDCQSAPAAREAALLALEAAWQDGPPFAYHRGVIQATEILQLLGEPLPQTLIPFSTNGREPLLELDLDPEESQGARKA
jgi:hypothetical protein